MLPGWLVNNSRLLASQNRKHRNETVLYAGVVLQIALVQ